VTKILLHIRFLLEWIFLKGMLFYLRSGDFQRARRRTIRLAHLGMLILRDNWKWTLKNLSIVYGVSVDPKLRIKLGRLAFEQHFQTYMEGLRFRDVTVESSTMNVLVDAYRKNRGVILCTVHLGSWEPSIRRIVEEGVPLAVVSRKALNPMSDREFRAVRSSYEAEWIQEHDGRSIIRALQEHKILVLLTDLDTEQGGIPASFLGVEAMCPPGVPHLALRYAPFVVPCVSLRIGIGRVSFIVEKPIDPRDFADHPEAAKEITDVLNAIFEKWIWQYPEQYNWLHPRWQSRPDASKWKLSDPMEKLWKDRTTGTFPVLPPRVFELLK